MLLARSGQICPFCQLGALPSATAKNRLQHGSFVQLRYKGGYRPMDRIGASKKQNKLVERMSLPSNIGRPPAGRPTKGSSTSRRTTGPFASLNRTSAPPSFAARGTSVSAQMQKRTNPIRKAADSKDPKKSKKKDEPFRPRALKMQSALAHVDYDTRTRVKSTLQDTDSFYNFDLLPVIQETVHNETLRGLTDISPTPIQRLAIPPLIQSSSPKSMKQFLIAAETGSGKTLAYVLPLVDALKRGELAGEIPDPEPPQSTVTPPPSGQADAFAGFEVEPPTPNVPHPTTARPRAIVLVPTSELVEQIGSVLKDFSHTAKLKVELLSTAYTATVIRNRLFSTRGIDVVISTPQLLKSIVESEPNILSRVSHLVIDEADSLLDRSFAPFTSGIIDRSTPSLKKLILCSATIPKAFDKYLSRRFPDIARFVAPNLHAIPRRVQLSTVDIDKDPYHGNRELACADAIWQIGQSSAPSAESEDYDSTQAKRVLVFVNQREKSDELAAYLVTKGVDAVALHRDTRGEKTAKILSAFTASSPTPVSDLQAPKARGPAFQPTGILANVKVLVMTDLGSRGIDTIAVRNVILYDVPNTSVDFIHRLGRTGRMGRRGRAIVLVGKKDRKDIVSEVRQSMFRGQALI